MARTSRKKAPQSVITPPLPDPIAPASALRHWALLVFFLALIPLVLTTFFPGKPMTQTLESLFSYPQVEEKVSQLSEIELRTLKLPQLASLIPDGKLPGALLAGDSSAHWIFAVLSAGVFACVLFVVFRCALSYFITYFLSGVFTATAGIFLLVGFQFAAEYSITHNIQTSGFTTLLLKIVQAVGYSYRCVNNPDIGLVKGFLGYTAGVGLCEELCKAAPILFIAYFTSVKSWRYSVLIGLASGIGFGVSEGIHYSAAYYNGILGGQIYLVRFLSCVSLHALWAGASALLIHRFNDNLSPSDSVFYLILYGAFCCLPSILLHGAYDALLHANHPAIALAPALLTFVYFFWMYGWSFHTQVDVEREDQP